MPARIASGTGRDDEEMKGEKGEADGGADVEVENEEIEKETNTETGKQREQLWREEKNFNCQGNPKRASGRTAYIAGTIRLRSCLPSGTELGTKQLGSQWDHISTTAPVGRNKMASAIRLLFHPRGRDRPYFILLPRPRSSKRTPCSPSAVQSANCRRKPPPCFFPASCVEA